MAAMMVEQYVLPHSLTSMRMRTRLVGDKQGSFSTELLSYDGPWKVLIRINRVFYNDSNNAGMTMNAHHVITAAWGAKITNKNIYVKKSEWWFHWIVQDKVSAPIWDFKGVNTPWFLRLLYLVPAHQTEPMLPYLIWNLSGRLQRNCKFTELATSNHSVQN